MKALDDAGVRNNTLTFFTRLVHKWCFNVAIIILVLWGLVEYYGCITIMTVIAEKVNLIPYNLIDRACSQHKAEGYVYFSLDSLIINLSCIVYSANICILQHYGLSRPICAPPFLRRALAMILKRGCISSVHLYSICSDNGPWLIQRLQGGSAGPLYEGKTTTWEGGVREPGIANWPGTIAPEIVAQQVVATYDIFPTMLTVHMESFKCVCIFRFPPIIVTIPTLGYWVCKWQKWCKGQKQFVATQMFR